MYRRRELECEDGFGEVYYSGAVVFYCVVVIVFKGVVGNCEGKNELKEGRKKGVIFSLLSFISLLLIFKGVVGNFVKERKGGS